MSVRIVRPIAFARLLAHVLPVLVATSSFARLALADCDAAWSELAPPVRADHSAVWDPIGHRMVVFGGQDWGVTATTWTLSLDSPAWTELLPSGIAPAPRRNHTAIWDEAQSRMIVFGGTNGVATFDDVYALDLVGTPTWSSLAPAGTAPRRSGHAAVYAIQRNSMIVFGGSDGEVFANDVWELTLSGAPAWTHLVVAGTPPAARAGSGAVWDALHHRVIVFGGRNGSGILNDTWSLDLSGTPTWSPLTPAGAGPVDRTHFTATLDAPPGGVQDRMIVFGGNLSGAVYSDTYALSLSGAPGTETWSVVTTAHQPPARANHAAIYVRDSGRLVMFGGSDGAAYRGETWQIDIDAATPDWSPFPVAQDRPSPRARHRAIVDEARGRMIVYGGIQRSNVLNDVWSLDLAGTSVWTALAPSGSTPPGRYAHAAVYDAARERMVMFGGATESGFANDAWALALSGSPAWAELTPSGTPPAPRLAHAAIYDPMGDRMIVFGGHGGGTSYGDTWELSFAGGGSWTQLAPLGGPPPTGLDFEAAYDPLRQRMILFGGTQTWALELSGTLQWQQLATSGMPPAPPAAGHSVVYDSARDRLVVFAGLDSSLDETVAMHHRVYTLTLAGSPTWSQLGPCLEPPAGRFDHSAVYDAARDRMVAFGGVDPARYDAWSLQFAPVVNAVPRATPGAELAITTLAPNPTAGAVRVRFTLPRAGRVALDVFDMQGRRVAALIHRTLEAGTHEVRWEGARPVAGIYFARLAFGGQSRAQRVAVIR